MVAPIVITIVRDTPVAATEELLKVTEDIEMDA